MGLEAVLSYNIANYEKFVYIVYNIEELRWTTRRALHSPTWNEIPEMKKIPTKKLNPLL